MKRAQACLGLAAIGLAVVVASALGQPHNELLKDEQHFLEQSTKTYTGGQKAAQIRNMEVVGHTDLAGRGFNGDVWVHEEYAYVGHWGFQDWANGSKNRFARSRPKAAWLWSTRVLPTSPKSSRRCRTRSAPPPRTSSSTRLWPAPVPDMTSPRSDSRRVSHVSMRTQTEG